MHQIDFIKLIIEYLVKNGMINDNRVLTEDPFRSVGNIELCADYIDIRTKLLNSIKEIEENDIYI